MFRSIHETLHAPAPTARSQQTQLPISGQRAPARDTRQSSQSTNTNTAPSPLTRADSVDYISGVTFNIPIDNDPINIFNLLSAYVSAGTGTGTAGAAGTGTGTGTAGTGAAGAAGTGAAGAAAAAAAARNVANNTIGMRYSDITNNHRTYDACPITREPFATDELVLMLQCNHYFSENGLNRWLVSHSTCPVCRFNINNPPIINNNNANYD